MSAVCVQVIAVLRDLDVFFRTVEPQVEAITGEESDTAQFERLVAVFNKVREFTVYLLLQSTTHPCCLLSSSWCSLQVNHQQVEMDRKFGAVHRAVVILEKLNHPLPLETRQQFEAAPQR